MQHTQSQETLFVVDAIAGEVIAGEVITGEAIAGDIIAGREQSKE